MAALWKNILVRTRPMGIVHGDIVNAGEVGASIMIVHEGSAAVLKACPLFAGAEAGDIAALEGIAARLSWAGGAMIFQRGDPPDFLVVIETGRIRLGLDSAAGRELTIRHAGPGAVIGEMAVLDNQSRSADAVAATQTRGLVIRRAAFEQLLSGHPGLARAVIRYLVSRLRDTTYQLESLALYDLSARLARFLLASLRQVHGGSPPPVASLALDLDQSDIAAILGASRPKVNRAFADLLKSGAISRREGGLICHAERLGAIAEAGSE